MTYTATVARGRSVARLGLFTSRAQAFAMARRGARAYGRAATACVEAFDGSSFGHREPGTAGIPVPVRSWDFTLTDRGVSCVEM